jgi:hypothetical protein
VKETTETPPVTPSDPQGWSTAHECFFSPIERNYSVAPISDGRACCYVHSAEEQGAVSRPAVDGYPLQSGRDVILNPRNPQDQRQRGSVAPWKTDWICALHAGPLLIIHIGMTGAGPYIIGVRSG